MKTNFKSQNAIVMNNDCFCTENPNWIVHLNNLNNVNEQIECNQMMIDSKLQHAQHGAYSMQ